MKTLPNRAAALLLASALAPLAACGGKTSSSGGSIISGRATLSGLSDSSGIVALAMKDGAVLGSGLSDSAGDYEILGLADGDYTLEVQAPSTQERRVDQPLKVHGATTAPAVKFTPIGLISGMLKLPAGCDAGALQAKVVWNGQTANPDPVSGAFSLLATPGTADLQLQFGSGSPTVLATNVIVQYQHVAQAGTVSATFGGAVKGAITVAGASGADLSGTSVHLAGPCATDAKAAADGTFTFPGLPPGDYTAQAFPVSAHPDAANSVPLAHVAAAAVNVTLAFKGYGTVTGTATLGGAKSGNAVITVSDGAGNTAACADDGSYTLQAAPGTTSVTATAPSATARSATVTPTATYNQASTAAAIAL